MISSTKTINMTGLDGKRFSLTTTLFDDLSARIDGSLVQQGDEGWDDAVLIWNSMVARVPALVLQPSSTADVARAVSFARQHSLLLSIKGGGHNIAGTSIADGGLMLDMSRMRTISVDPIARLAHAGPGCLLRDVDQATQRYGLATVLGFVSEVGIAGLTLGGGFGHLSRQLGWTVDNLEEVEIVTADGTVRIANRAENAELFWAIRGGGGNFGVVTRFTFRLYEVGPTITGGLIVWSAEHAEAVLKAYRDLTNAAPRALTAAIVIRLAPPAPFVPAEMHGKPTIGMLLCHSGPNAEVDLMPIRALPDPIFDLVAEKPYVEQQSMLDAMEPKGLQQYWKTEYLPSLSDQHLETFCDAALELTSPLSYSVIFHIGGALNDREPDDGAVGNRDAQFISGFSAVWPRDVPSDEHVAWARDGWKRIRPFSTGGNYVNFHLAEDDHTRTTDAYGLNYTRLQQVKADYDPDNLFRVNRNIAPLSTQ